VVVAPATTVTLGCTRSGSGSITLETPASQLLPLSLPI
jgi:hypothetical protein